MKKNKLILWGILLLASIFRLYQPGLLPTWVDELNIIDAALKLARHGEWIWFGNTTSFVGIETHSPFTVYVTALPALIFANPLAMRLFYGFLGLIVIVLVYEFMQRYAGKNAAIFSALFLAVMPLPVYWSRFVWNPNTAPIFIMIWLFSARGYFNNKVWFQAIHWLSLGFIIQSQTALLVLIPTSLVLTIYGAWSARHQYRSYLLHHLIILSVLIISLLPWFYGLYGISHDWFRPTYGYGKIDSGQIDLTFPNLGRVWDNFSLLTASVGYQKATLEISANAAVWWAPNWLHTILGLQAVIILVGALVLILRGIRKYQLNTWHFFLAVMLFYPLGFHIVKRSLPDFYMMPITYVGIVILGISLQYALSKTRLTIIIAAILFIAQSWLSISILNRFHDNPETLSYSEIIDMVDTWSDHGQREVLVLENNSELVQLEQHDWVTHWRILSDSYPIRYVTDSLTLAIDSQGQLIVTDTSNQWIKDWLGDGEIFETPERAFMAIPMTFADLPEPTFIPENPQFDNMIYLIGAAADIPQASEQWQVNILWEPQQSISEQYQFSVRLQADDGQRYGQIDGSTLSPELWRSGERVLTGMIMQVSDTLPTEAELHLEIILYRLRDGQTVPVLDNEGHPIGEQMTLVLNSG